jgi:hypothetical protein
MFSSYLEDTPACAPQGRPSCDHTDEIVLAGCNHDKNTAGISFSYLREALFSIDGLDFEIEGIVQDDLFGFFGRNVVPPNVLAVYAVPIEHHAAQFLRIGECTEMISLDGFHAIPRNQNLGRQK